MRLDIKSSPGDEIPERDVAPRGVQGGAPVENDCSVFYKRNGWPLVLICHAFKATFYIEYYHVDLSLPPCQ